MKTVFVCLALATISVVEISGGIAYDAKADAIKAIDESLKSANDEFLECSKHIDDEEKKIDNKTITAAKDSGKLKLKELEAKIDSMVLDTAQKAVENKKTESCFTCIIEQSVNGKANSIKLLSDYTHNLDGIVSKKKEILSLKKIEIELLKNSLKELMTKTKDLVKATADKDLPNVVAKAKLHSEAAKSVTYQIMDNLCNPNIRTEFAKVKRTFEDKLGNLEKEIKSNLDSCLNKPPTSTTKKPRSLDLSCDQSE